MSYLVENLNQKSRYEFWVTAHTAIGEGLPSTKATISPSSRIPAKIASFDEVIIYYLPYEASVYVIYVSLLFG